jgi:multicomponent Na+:H+ antiporter subunit A
MLGVVLADHSILLFLFWELTSISSFFLIGFLHSEATSRWNAQQALLVTGTGGMCLLAGFLMIGTEWGTHSLEAWRGMAVAGREIPVVALALMLAGAATKSALFPFFFWLPNAMSAPTPVSSYLHSATMVKAGIFLIGALFPLFASSAGIMGVIVGMGAATAVTGLALGWVQTDLKKILAYTTLSVLGLLAFLLGLGTVESVRVAVLLLLGHACYKAGLFMAAGAIDKATGTRDLRALAGLSKTMPALWAASLFLGLSAVGFPPLLGFLGKEYGYGLILPEKWMSYALSAFLFLANLAMMTLILRVALKPFRPDASVVTPGVKPIPKLMMLGPVALAAAGLALGLTSPLYLSPVVGAVVSGIAGDGAEYRLALWHGFKPALYMSVATLAGGWFIYRMAVTYGKQNAVTRGLGFAENTYTAMVKGLMIGAAKTTNFFQNGDLRRYLHFFFGGILLLVAAKWWTSGFGVTGLFDGIAQVPVLEGLLVVAMAFAILLVVLTMSRITAVLGLAIIGLGMAFLFARLGAPDLALTLMLVESLTVVLFIYIVHGLPKIRNITKAPGRIFDAALSLAVGGTMALLALKSQTVQLHPTISGTLNDWSYSLAKGKNVVNVILVDFRALDTLGEITVIALAAVGVRLLWLRKPDLNTKGGNP